MAACCNLVSLSLGLLLVAWWLAGGHVPASYDRPPVTNADGSVYFDHTNLVMPSSTEEIVQIVESANRDLRRIKVLGAGHSRSAIAHSSDIYISLYNYRGIVRIDRDNMEVVVRAGTLLNDFVRELERNGLALETLPTLGDQTIGGALAVGSHATGVEYGNLATLVTHLVFVSGTGRVVSINATTDQDLFNAALVSMGMIGILTEVTFRFEQSFNLRENLTILPLSYCLENFEVLSKESEHGKLWLVTHGDVCALFNVWRTREEETVEQGVGLWDLKNRVTEPLLWLGTWFPSINPNVLYFLYNYISVFTPYVRVAASSEVFIPPLYVPANHQLELAVDIKDCLPALREWEKINKDNPYTNIFTEVRYVKKDEFFLSPNFQRDTCHITIIIYNPPHHVLREYFDDLCRAFSRFSARPHWAKYLCGLQRSELDLLYPKLSEFAEIRSKMDPNSVFLNGPLTEIFDFQPT